MTFNTRNPIGSTDARDLSDNAENFDKALGTLSPTWTDRLGVTRDSFEGRLAKGSFYRVGTFAAGYSLTNMRQALEYDGHEYSWAGTFPKVVAAGATPATSGGISAGAWVDRTDVTLRSDINIVVKRFASVADAVADTSLVIGNNVKTTAYYNGWSATASGLPLGGNDYVVVAAGTGSTDGGSFIDLANGLQLKGLFFGGKVTACQFGAKADGVTADDQKINAALVFSKKVELDAGTYATSGPIYYTNQELFGAGATSTTIKPSGKFSALKYNGTYLNGGSIRDLMIDFGSDVPVLSDASVGIDYGSSTDTNWPARYTVENVYIRGATRAIQDDTGAWSGKYSKVWAQKCRLAFSKQAGTMTLFEQCYSDACLQAWLCVNAHTVTLINCAADKWDTTNGAALDFNNCPSFCIDGLQMEAGTLTDNGIVIRAYNNSNGKLDGVNLYNTKHNITAGNVGSVIYSYGENTNISVTGLKVSPILGFSGYTGTMRLLSAMSQSKISANSCYLGGISGGYGTVYSGYAESLATLCLDETVEYEHQFEGGDIRFGQVYFKNGLKSLSSVSLAAGESIKYEVPISGLLTGDMVIATPTFQSQGEVITARYYNASYASIIIQNPTTGTRILNGNIYVQVIRHFSNALS